MSSLHSLPGGGPQGDNLGIEEFLSQTNGNTKFLQDDENYKIIDNLSLLEMLTLICSGVSRYAEQRQVLSDIGRYHSFKIKSQVIFIKFMIGQKGKR